MKSLTGFKYIYIRLSDFEALYAIVFHLDLYGLPGKLPERLGPT